MEEDAVLYGSNSPENHKIISVLQMFVYVQAKQPP